jgi:hypothetical protein
MHLAIDFYSCMNACDLQKVHPCSHAFTFYSARYIVKFSMFVNNEIIIPAIIGIIVVVNILEQLHGEQPIGYIILLVLLFLVFTNLARIGLKFVR